MEAFKEHANSYATTRRELEAELHRLVTRIARVKALIKGLDELNDAPTPVPGGKFSNMGIADAVAQLLKERPEGMKTRELADALLKHGVRTKSQGNWVTNVYATLRAGTRFKVHKGTWTLTKEGRQSIEE